VGAEIGELMCSQETSGGGQCPHRVVVAVEEEEPTGKSCNPIFITH
jgi:hypothetical protein